MKLHLLQKIGLIGVGVVLLLCLSLYLFGSFSVYGFTLLMPFMVLLLIGYSVNNSRREK